MFQEYLKTSCECLKKTRQAFDGFGWVVILFSVKTLTRQKRFFVNGIVCLGPFCNKKTSSKFRLSFLKNNVLLTINDRICVGVCVSGPKLSFLAGWNPKKQEWNQSKDTGMFCIPFLINQTPHTTPSKHSPLLAHLDLTHPLTDAHLGFMKFEIHCM